jgi:hypothetical protein
VTSNEVNLIETLLKNDRNVEKYNISSILIDYDKSVAKTLLGGVRYVEEGESQQEDAMAIYACAHTVDRLLWGRVKVKCTGSRHERRTSDCLCQGGKRCGFDEWGVNKRS